MERMYDISSLIYAVQRRSHTLRLALAFMPNLSFSAGNFFSSCLSKLCCMEDQLLLSLTCAVDLAGPCISIPQRKQYIKIVRSFQQGPASASLSENTPKPSSLSTPIVYIPSSVYCHTLLTSTVSILSPYTCLPCCCLLTFSSNDL